MRRIIHYGLTLFLIGIYGVQICPFIETLSTLEIVIPLAGIISIQYALYHFIDLQQIRQAPYKNRAGLAFRYEWALFILSGCLITIYNSIYNDFPIVSGLKLVVGFSILGFYAATDLALEREFKQAIYLKETGIFIIPDKRYFPLTGKFSLLAIISTLFMVGVFFLLINKDLDWISQSSQQIPLSNIQGSILIEFSFVGLILLAYMINTILAYTRNINYFFNSQRSVMQRVIEGDLSANVVVSSNDEFGEMAHHTNFMIETLHQQTEEIQRTQDVTIHSLASLAETRDNETGAHLLRTQHYIRALAETLQTHPAFRSVLNEKNINLLYKSAPLHDIGKVGIPDNILLKPGTLDEKEFKIMMTHASLGAESLQRAEESLGTSTFLHFAREIAATHHEKWDGSGYPDGLKGKDIPVSGRLMAVADVYDALICKRVYKPAFSHEKAMEIMIEGRGQHFDPDIIDALLSIESEFIAIADQFRDETTHPA